ncbi:MAG: 4'-phosphopantetheinyl transferase superfamily protein [Elusimicrobia bacterium]|nr:4'-phosphopantetheinyl transferase superfamily protein [Elusimicrobiota bacterium]
MTGAACMDLAGIVAKLAECSPAEVGPDFSLDRPGLQGSMRRSVLIASIRKHLGVDCMAAVHARTFGELSALVSGGSGAGEPSPSLRAVPEELRKAGSLSFLRCGIDIESVEMLPKAEDYAAHPFYHDNFTADEIAYCGRQPDPRPHFAARWCAKEALKKSEPSLMAEPMSSLEVVRTDSGALFLRRRGKGGSKDLPHSVSVSHTESVAAAVVVAGPAAWVMRWSWLLLVLGLAAGVTAGMALFGGLR